MRSPDHTDAARIEGLLRGLPPETEREARLEGMLRELRAGAPTAPADVRERVRTLREPARPVRKLGWRPALVLVPLALAFAGAALLGRGDGGNESAAGERVGEGGSAAATTPAYAPEQDGATAPWSGTRSATQRQLAPAITPPFALADDAARAQEWDVTLELRVPTRRIQDAIARFSGLGTITAQNVAVQDRQADLDRLARRIDALRVQIAVFNLRLRTETLNEAERLRLE